VGQFLQQLLNGIHLGSIYALIALGYTMVYGVLRLINFAHGDVYMVGAYVGLVIAARLGTTTTAAAHPGLGTAVLVMLGSMAGCALLGLVIERFAYRPLRRAPRLAALITAIGLSLLPGPAVFPGAAPVAPLASYCFHYDPVERSDHHANRDPADGAAVVYRHPHEDGESDARGLLRP
jgi:hypothetical protein